MRVADYLETPQAELPEFLDNIVRESIAEASHSRIACLIVESQHRDDWVQSREVLRPRPVCCGGYYHQHDDRGANQSHRRCWPNFPCRRCLNSPGKGAFGLGGFAAGTCNAFDRGDELITAPGKRSDITGHHRIVIECQANLCNAEVQPAIEIDERFDAPNGAAQFLAGHCLTGTEG